MALSIAGTNTAQDTGTALTPITDTTSTTKDSAQTPLINVDIFTASSQVTNISVSQATLPSPMLAHGDAEAALINKDNAPSKPSSSSSSSSCNTITAPVDGPAIPSHTEGPAVYVGKENILQPLELTQYQKTVLTKAHQKAEAQQKAGELMSNAAEELVVQGWRQEAQADGRWRQEAEAGRRI